MQNYGHTHAPFIIIGAGISGLQAAYNLAQMGQKFIVLEALDRIGGRICTLTIGQALKQDKIQCNYSWFSKVKDVSVEVGATWICQDNTAMLQLAKKYNVELFPQFYEGKHILALTEDKKLHVSDYSEYYRQHQHVLVPMILKMWKVKDRYWALVELKQKGELTKEDDQELKDIYEKYDTMTGFEFILGEVHDQFLANLVDNEIVTLQAISSKQFTAMHFLLDDSGWDGLFYYLGLDNFNIDGFRAAKGLKSLLDAMKKATLEQLKKHNLPHQEHRIFRLNHPVAQIRNQFNPVQVITEKGQTFTCNKVLLALPDGTLYKIKFGLLSQTKRLLMNNQLNSWCVRMTMVFKQPFWRYSKHSGNVNFSHQFLMNELVELTPPDQSCGIVAFVFFKEGYLKWNQTIDKETFYEDEQQLKRRKYELNKMKCLKIMADLYLNGDVDHPYLKQCIVFTRSLSWQSYIRNTYDSTPRPQVYKELYERNLDNVDPSADEHNIIMLGSDFSECDELSGYMQGAVRIANRKINKCLVAKL